MAVQFSENLDTPGESGAGMGSNTCSRRPSVETHASSAAYSSSAQHEEHIALFGPFGKGLLDDLKTKLPWYCSDFTDGFQIKTIITVLYLFWGAIANAVAFGALLGANTDG